MGIIVRDFKRNFRLTFNSIYRGNTNSATSANTSASVLLLACFAVPTYAAFPPIIDVVTDTNELRTAPVVTIDGEFTVSRPMGDLDGDGLGDRIIEISPTNLDPCPGVAVLPSTLNTSFSFSRAELDNLVRIVDEEITANDGSTECKYRNFRVFTEPRRIGDVNGDGLIDLAVNISGIFNNVPRVIFGTTSAGTQINIDNLDGSNGFAVVGNGHIITPVGDVNGDGFWDLAFSSGSSDITGVITGRPGFSSLLDVSTQSSEEYLVGPLQASSITGLGDINGDGNSDLIAFPAGQDPFAENQIPRIIYGAPDLAISSLSNGDPRVVRLLEECGIRQCTFNPVGDIDGDGLDDVIASQRFETNNLPPTSIIYGQADGWQIRNAIADYPDGERTRLVTEATGTIADSGDFYRGNFNDTYRITSGQGLDFDDDGVEDLILAQRSQNTTAPRGWFVFFGLQNERPPVRSFAEADGLLGVAMDLSTAVSPITNLSLPEIADLDLDGVDDILWTTRRNVPFVPGRSREIEGIDVSGLRVRRSPDELNLFWNPVSGATSYRIQFNDAFIDEVSNDTTTLDVPDSTGGGTISIRVEALDANGLRLTTQLRQVPAFSPLLEDFSITVHGIDLLELFVLPNEDQSGRRLTSRLTVLRDGQVIGRISDISFTDTTVQPGTQYSYQLITDEFPGVNVNDVVLESAPRFMRATQRIVVETPPDPNSGSTQPIEPTAPVEEPANGPEPVSNLRVVRYSAFDAEIMWDRSDEPALQYEVFRDGILVSTQFGISFYDPRRPENTGSIYQVVALRADGSRSEPRTITLAPINGGSSAPTTPVTETPGVDIPAAPQNLRVTRYSAKDAEVFWDRASEPGIRYEVFRDGVLQRTGFGISFFDTTLQPGASARYEVIAIAPNGSRSMAATVDLSGEGNPPNGQIPSPEGITATVYSDSAAELFWNRAPIEAGVITTEVSRNGELLGSTQGNSFFDATRVIGVTYVYSLVSMNTQGIRSTATVIEVAN